MRLVSAGDADELATLAADLIALEIEKKPDLTLLAATGNTPMGAYAELVQRYKAGTLETTGLRVVQLDDYLGVADDDPRSLYAWLASSLTGPLGVAPERVLRFHSLAADPIKDCQRVDSSFESWGGVDLAVLGLGPNGHLGFNEPPSAADAPTRVVTLSAASLASNAAYWGGRDVPRTAVTLGMKQILAARRVLLLVSGAHKRGILERTLGGPVTPELPASLLRDTNLTVIADRAALGETA